MTQVQQLFDALKLVPQSKVHHPEGDVFTHTALVKSRVLYRMRGNEPILTVAAIWHDTGKLATTVVHEDGRVTAHDHELVSCDLFDQLGSLCHPTFTTPMLRATRFIIRNHMRVKKLDEMRANKVERFKKDCAEMDKVCPLSGHMDMFMAMQLFADCDRMTNKDGVLREPHKSSLKSGAVQAMERTLLSMRREEIKETTRIRVRKELEENS